MPDPIREQVLAAFKTKLAAITGVSGLTVHRNRDTEVVQFPALNVLDGNQTADDGVTGYTRYEMEVAVEGWVKSTTALLGSDLNQLYAKTVQQAVSDRTLGGLCVDVLEVDTAVDLNRAEGQAPSAAFLTTFQIIFMTKQGDPFTLAP